MQQQERNFICLLREAVLPGCRIELQEADFPAILDLAEKHAITGLLYPPLKKLLPPTDPILREMKKKSFSAATRESIQAKELSQIFSAFEEAKLPVLPLKGCVIKELYPYPELRFMSDADLLVREQDAQAVRRLMEQLGYTYKKVDAGDTDVYLSPVGMNYEIHLSLRGEGFSEKSRSFAESLLELAQPKAPYTYVKELPPVEHYVYILCHFIKHFIYGGVGVRQLTDLYICQKKWSLDQDPLNRILRELELSRFYKNLQELWLSWFENAPESPHAEALGDYILSSGVFGTEEKRSTDRMLQNGQGSKYVLSRLFPPYSTMSGYFPILKKAPVLLPCMWGWRAVRAMLFRRKKLSAELSAFENADEKSLQDRRSFYANCGLTVYDNIGPN